MAKLSQSVLVGASLAPVWDHYFEVDRLARLGRRLPGGRVGGRLSGGGRDAGLALDPGRPGDGDARRVLAHEPARLHRIAFSDPESSGELTSRFEVEGEGTG